MPVDVTLVIYNGPEAGKKQAVTRSPFLVGRGADVDLSLADLSLSRRHCQILVDGDDVAIEDLKSTCGTFVNEQHIGQQVKLKDRDRITIATTQIMVYIQPAARRAAGGASLPVLAEADTRIDLGKVSLYHLGDSSLEQPPAGSRPVFPDPPRGKPAQMGFASKPNFPFANPNGLLYAVVDGGRDLDLAHAAKLSGYEPVSLFIGESAASLAMVAPYFFSLRRDADYIGKWAGAIGNSSGVLIDSPAPADQVFTHLRYLFVSQDEAGEEYFLRFYDPRVLRPYLPSCTPDELTDFFGPIKQIFVESEEADGYWCYSRGNDGRLKTERLGMIELKK